MASRLALNKVITQGPCKNSYLCYFFGATWMSSISSSITSLPAVVDVLKKNANSVDRDATFPTESVSELGKADLLGLIIPKKFGGAEASADTFVSIVGQLAGACASTGMIFVMHCGAIETIVRHMDNDAGRKVLESAARGTHLTTLACSERSTGANFYASLSTSVKEKDGFVLNGEKCFVTSGTYADSYVVPTRADGSEDSISTTLYLVPKDASGVKFTGTWNGVGLRGNNSIVLKLDKCWVPAANVIGAEGKGFDIEMSIILPRFLLGTAAVYTGIARAAYQAAAEHVKTRTLSHAAESLADFAVVRRYIAEMKVALDASEAMLHRAARQWEEAAPELMITLLETKQFCCQSSVDITRKAMQACGGIAYSATLPLERHLRDAMAGPVMAPTNDMLLDFIGRAELGLPLL